MNKKAIFLDIDGTLTYGGPNPPERNVSAIRAARAAGHKVFINTGRAFGFIPREVFDAIEFDGVVCGGGAYVKVGDKLLCAFRMKPDTLRDICRCILKEPVPCIFEGESETFYIEEEKWDDSWRLIEQPDDFDTKYSGMAVTKLTVFAEMSDELRKIVGKDMTIIDFPTYSEAIIKGCSKATGIRTVLDEIGISAEDCIAMGDSANDVAMLKFAGTSVAMGNAPDEVKALCDYVSCHASEGGVGEAIEKLVL